MLGEPVDAGDDVPEELEDEEPDDALEGEELESEDPVELDAPAPALSPEVESVERAVPRLSLR